MTTAEKLQTQIKKLPEALQTEVLHFVEFLLEKEMRQENDDWTNLSLTTATRDIEDEDAHTYTMADLKVMFQSKE